MQIWDFMLNFTADRAVITAAFRSWRAKVLTRGNPEERRLFPIREYELVVIFHPDLDENAMTELIKRISSWITEDGGELLKTDIWGRREMAYLIRKQKYGQYVLFHSKMDPKLGTTLERNLGFLEPVMRYLIVAKE